MSVQVALADGQVQVWYADLDAAFPAPPYLAPDEERKMAAYHFDHLRQRYRVGRGLLRVLISGYLGIAPDHVRFIYNAYGKPALPPLRDGRCLSFNVSHSESAALYAFAWDRDLGVDIERMRPFDMQSIVEHSFSARELQAWSALPDSLKQEAFFAVWTRKEAFIKAVGMGLSLPLDSFDVSLHPHEPARLLEVRGEPAVRCSLRDLIVPPGYKACLAAAGQGWEVCEYAWVNG